MSEIKHTPGPWTVDHMEAEKPYVRIRGTRLGERYKIANVLQPVYEGADKIEVDETCANARLIAAAPDLLEALRLCYDHCRLYYPEVEHNNVGEAVRSALAKATGA